jgi:hypothetical protein
MFLRIHRGGNMNLKIKIHSTQTLIPGGRFWTTTINGKATHYTDYDAAFKAISKRLKREYKEAAAYSRVMKVSINLLAIHEQEFVKKLQKSKCRGITPKQYGYLAGIFERQERAW